MTKLYALIVLVSLAFAGCSTAEPSAATDAPRPEEGTSKQIFTVGVATRDITPQAAVPMWGYGSRHAALSQGVIDPLFAKAIVIRADDEKLALVGMDLGRGPTGEMMERIRGELADKAGIRHVMICGSHTHHGPVIELADRDGYGRGKFDDAVAYNQHLPDVLIDAILAADMNARPATIGVATDDVPFNRNRHTHKELKPVDPTLRVIRFDDVAGKPIAVIVNYAAHPTMIRASDLRFSADYPGAMRHKVEAGLATHCVFLNGAAGDLSASAPAGTSGHAAMGDALADRVLALARQAKCVAPDNASLHGKMQRFRFASRVDYTNPLITAVYAQAFFPEMVRAYIDDFREGIQPEMTTVVLNDQIALVGVSGEFFCEHANRLKRTSNVPWTLLVGYCNGHHLYFPTVEATREAGYGADMTVSPVEVGAGEQMIDAALSNLREQTKLPVPEDGG